MTTSKPATRAEPPSGWISVVRMRTAVVFPRSVRPEQPEHAARFHVEVDAQHQRLDVAVALPQFVRLDGRLFGHLEALPEGYIPIA